MDAKKVAVTAMMIVITFVIVFNILGSTSNTITKAGDSVTDANNCTDATGSGGEALYFNSTTQSCYNSSGGSYTASLYDLPLNALFGSSGVIILVVMAAIMIAAIGWALRMR